MRRRLHVTGPLVAVLLAVAVLAAACGSDSKGAAASSDGNTTTAAAEKPTTVRLGYFPNITHATAIVGVEQGIFQKALGNDKLTASTFNAGPAATEALLSGAIDATYIGPNPAINAFAKSKGEALRIISGATSGGAALVVKPSITKAADLKGKKIASPQLANTQDVALRYWFQQQGLKADAQGGGDVSILPQENSQTLDAFKAGSIDGAWVPEPWATRLVQEGGGKVLVNEKDLWPGGQFVTTHLIVATKFLQDHPDAVRRLLQGQVEANAFVNAHTDEAQKIVNDGIAKITGKPLKDETIKAAWSNLQFTDDPIASSLAASAQHAEKVGLLDKVDLKGIYSLDLLNVVLKQAGEQGVKGA
jgi:NitT/TauT family transport system substrate-binding protein